MHSAIWIFSFKFASGSDVPMISHYQIIHGKSAMTLHVCFSEWQVGGVDAPMNGNVQSNMSPRFAPAIFLQTT